MLYHHPKNKNIIVMQLDWKEPIERVVKNIEALVTHLECFPKFKVIDMHDDQYYLVFYPLGTKNITQVAKRLIDSERKVELYL